MPLKLESPKPGRSPNWRIRGTYLGVHIDRSAGSPDRRVAAAALKSIKEQIERGAIQPNTGPHFEGAAISYLHAGGDGRFMKPLFAYWGKTPLHAIDQPALDACAATLYPNGTPATRNRQVYTPVLAVLHHAGHATTLRRPKGGNGERRAHFLTPEQLFRLIDAAEAIDGELGCFFTFLPYTGVRLSEALGLLCADVDLSRATAFVRDTKNGDPRMVHLPPVVVTALANHPRGLNREGRVFRWTKGQRLNDLMHKAYEAAGVPHGNAPAHGLRHTYATLMRKYGGADDRDLLDTGAWRHRQSVQGYVHTDVSDAARKADKLPVKSAKISGR